MKLIVTSWGDGYELSGVETQVVRNDGTECSVEFSDGEKEDMYIARDLNDAKFIWKLVKAAYDAGKDGEEIEVVHKQRDEEE